MSILKLILLSLRLALTVLHCCRAKSPSHSPVDNCRYEAYLTVKLTKNNSRPLRDIDKPVDGAARHPGGINVFKIVSNTTGRITFLAI